MFAHRELRGGVGVAITDRGGGTSRSPWASLNLADHVGDDPGAVADNRRRLAEVLDVTDLVSMRQVHGADVAVVDEMPEEVPTADALVTRSSGLGLMVLVADCTPVLLSDRRAGVVAAVHAGRKGLAAGVVPATLEVMSSLGARPDRTYALVGPGICPEHYEVPEQMRADVDAAAPGSAATTRAGTPAIDIRSGIVRQLHEHGINRLAVLPQCTAEDDDFFSYRRDGVTGRFAGVVWRAT
ncbi:MAG TPA: peptidoglycan editing factor PgeF [Mycobacteriales bacterium]|nr:peptidoglycan editing factor PgeF [Mycobacteriales bacterium]